MIDPYSVIGFDGDRPVATASVLPLEGSLYVGLVATHPAMQRRGFAQATQQHALRQAGTISGLDATDLHASVAGRSLYLRLGYVPGVDFVAPTVAPPIEDQAELGLAAT